VIEMGPVVDHPVCPIKACNISYPHGHGTETFYVGRTETPRRQQPACGDLKIHRPHNGMAPPNPDITDPWCHGVGVPDFVEDTDSVRGPGWGTRFCPYCDHESFGGYESVTKEAIIEHIDERCPVTNPGAPSIGGFDAALYAAFMAGRAANPAEGDPEEFRKWRAQWHGEWVTE
jgi:hypothetical protein